MSRESLLDALDLDPELPLSELVDALRDEALSLDAGRRELARQAFEALTESPSGHFELLLATVPRRPVNAARPARREPPLRLPTVDALSRVSLAALLGPRDDAEEALTRVRAAPVDP